MVESYKIVYEGADGELVEKKSRFIAQIRPVASEEEAFAFIEEVRKKYWDARHHCYAYIIGERAQTARCSDDGEPSQTAGKPMMDVLAGEGLHDVCAVVTRYFGGYTFRDRGPCKSLFRCCKRSAFKLFGCRKKLGVQLEVTADYNSVGKIQYIAAQEGIDTLESRYSDKAEFDFLVPVAVKDSFQAKITEGTNGRARIRTGKRTVLWHEPGEKLIVFLKMHLDLGLAILRYQCYTIKP